jgi:electron transfer flavoprotein alpha subunit
MGVWGLSETEYIAHGARKVFVMDDPKLSAYSTETYSWLMVWLAKKYQPETLLVGATRFGQEMAPRVAKQLKTGLTADCIDFEINESGQLVQIAPLSRNWFMITGQKERSSPWHCRMTCQRIGYSF